VGVEYVWGLYDLNDLLKLLTHVRPKVISVGLITQCTSLVLRLLDFTTVLIGV